MNEINKHPYSFDQLQGFVDGTLDQAISGQIEQHIVSCPECRETVARIRALETKTAQACSADAPETYFNTFASRVSSRIAAKRESSRARRPWLAWWGWAPAAAAAVLVLLFALNPEHGLRQQAQLHDQLQKEKRQAPFVTIPLWSDTAGQGAAPGRGAGWGEPATPAITAHDDRSLSAQEEVRAAPEANDAAKPAPALEPAAKDELAAAAKTRKAAEAPSAPAAAPSAAPEPAVATGGIVQEKRTAAAPAASGPRTQRAVEQPAAPTAIGQLQVIVIHVPDGGAACPPPEIGAAIEIVLPADRPAAN